MQNPAICVFGLSQSQLTAIKDGRADAILEQRVRKECEDFTRGYKEPVMKAIRAAWPVEAFLLRFPNVAALPDVPGFWSLDLTEGSSLVSAIREMGLSRPLSEKDLTERFAGREGILILRGNQVGEFGTRSQTLARGLQAGLPGSDPGPEERTL